VSTTASQAIAAIKARIEAGGLAFPRRYQGEAADSNERVSLPDTPAIFAFIVFNNEGSGRGPAAFGGGRGSNLYRNQATVDAYVFAPNGEGLSVATDAAEQLATLLRSFRDSDISCFSADVIPVGPGSSIAPPGLSSAVNDYQCAVAVIALHFDQIG
jgi:hypothetical protein